MILIHALFFYYLKREPTYKEIEIHSNNYKINHNENITSIIEEFKNCDETKNNFNKEYNKKILLKFSNKEIIELENYIEIFNKNKINLLDDYKEISKLNLNKELYKYYNNNFIRTNYLNNNYNIIKFDKYCIYITANEKAGHNFVKTLNILYDNEIKNREFYLLFNKEYENKYKHIIEFINLINSNICKLIENNKNNIYIFEKSYEIYNKNNNGFYSDFYGLKNKMNLEIENYNNKLLKKSKYNKEDIFWTNLYYKNLIDISIDESNKINENLEKYDNIFLVKNTKNTPFNQDPFNGFNYDNIKDEIIDNNYKILDPQEISLDKLIYYLNNAKKIITSWNTIMYINKFFFNKEAEILVLCHINYNNEIYADFFDYRNTSYFIESKKLYYLENLNTNLDKDILTII